MFVAGLGTTAVKSESTGGHCNWSQVWAHPTCCSHLSPGTSDTAPEGTAAMIIHRARSVGIWERKVLPLHWICSSRGAIQEIILPRITHSSPACRPRGEFIDTHHSYFTCSQLFIKHTEIPLWTAINYQPVVNKTLRGKGKYEVNLVWFWKANTVQCWLIGQVCSESIHRKSRLHSGYSHRRIKIA